MKKICFFLFFLINLICFAQRPKITYLANEGILIEVGSVKIIIDGMFRDGLGIYEQLNKNQIENIKRAKGNFTNIDYILVSHLHRDHFDKELIENYLKANKACKVISSNQVIREIDTKYLNRLIGFNFSDEPGWKIYKDGNLEIKLGRMVHPYKKNANIINLAHSININGFNYLHIGDADMIDSNFKKLNINKFKFENVFIPFWFLVDEKGKILINKYLNSKSISAIHMQKGLNKSKIKASDFQSKVKILTVEQK